MHGGIGQRAIDERIVIIKSSHKGPAAFVIANAVPRKALFLYWLIFCINYISVRSFTKSQFFFEKNAICSSRFSVNLYFANTTFTTSRLGLSPKLDYLSLIIA